MTTLQWLPPYHVAVYIVLLAGCLLAVWLARRWATSPRAQSWLLIVLRLALLSLLILLLLNPTEVKQIPSPPRPAEMAFLVDCSQSMGLDRPTSRLDQVKETMRQAVPAGSPESIVKLDVFRFGRQLSAVSSSEELRAEDDATQLLDALERLPARFGGERPAGVVVFSDGCTTETSGFKEAAEAYHKWNVPLHVVPILDRGIQGDLAIQELVVPRSAPPGTKVPVHVQIASYGYEGRRAEIRIRSANKPWAKPLALLPVMLNGGTETFDLTIEPDSTAGDMILDITQLPGEAIAENNQVPFKIALPVKKLRVIYMEATPNQEYRWLRDALIEDPNIECLAMEVQTQYISNQRLHRVNDPSRGFPQTREELFGYDVVICSDIARTAFTQEQLDWTVELVALRGGGFAMVGGNTSFGAGLWDQTVWDELIPFKMSGDRPGSLGKGYTSGEFRAVIPAAVERHPIWRLAEDPRDNLVILNSMPKFYGTNLIDRVKPGATVLGVSDRRLPLAGVMPIFACQEFGKGRTFAMTTDTTATWGSDFESEWGLEGDNRYYRKFWRNVVKWLGENSFGGNKRLRTETDKVIYRPGQPIQVTAHAYNEQHQETGKYRIVARLKLPQPAGNRAVTPPALAELPLTAGGEEFAYRGKIDTPSIASLKAAMPSSSSSMRAMTLEVTAYDGNQVAGREELDVQVLDDSAEFHDLKPNPKRLMELAETSGGQVLHSGKDLSDLLATLKPAIGEPVISRKPAWDHPAFWFLLLSLLAVEWIFRRYRGLA